MADSTSPRFSPGTGLLLVGHGSREPVGVDEFLAAARGVAERVAPTAAEPCFLEFAQPTIAEGFQRLAARGVRRAIVVPVLLFAAGHAKRDIPQAVARAAADHPHIELRQSEPLGCHDDLLALSSQRFDEALAGSRLSADARTLLLLVGRGSHDPEATAHMRAFAARRAERTRGPLVGVEVAFVAMAEPTLDGGLQAAAQSAAERIVVQPHLLFGGVLLERIGRLVADESRVSSDKEWLVAAHLGPEQLVVRAIVARACETLAE